MAVHTAEAGGIAKLSFENPLWAPRPASRKRGASPPGCRPPGPQSSPSRRGPVAYAHGPADAAAAPCLARRGVLMPCRHWMQQIFQRPEYSLPAAGPSPVGAVPLQATRGRVAALQLFYWNGPLDSAGATQVCRAEEGMGAARRSENPNLSAGSGKLSLTLVGFSRARGPLEKSSRPRSLSLFRSLSRPHQLLRLSYDKSLRRSISADTRHYTAIT